jgi:sec-independent protein translocase protein TatC
VARHVARIRSVSHDEHLTLVEHLDELRTRLIISIGAFFVAFAGCYWQNSWILDQLDEPLPDGRHPITLGVTEPFMTTLTVSAYAALLVALPVILYQLYAFVLPAFSPTERRVALPLLLMVPVLFIGGVLFGYFLVLDPAVHFLLNFNEDQFNIEVRARDYYSFVTMTLVAMGIIFQVPMGILAVTRLGIATPKQLRQWRRYAYLGIAVVAALLPSIDPVSMLIEMVPLVILFELSIVLASLFGTPGERSAASANESPATETP